MYTGLGVRAARVVGLKVFYNYYNYEVGRWIYRMVGGVDGVNGRIFVN